MTNPNTGDQSPRPLLDGVRICAWNETLAARLSEFRTIAYSKNIPAISNLSASSLLLIDSWDSVSTHFLAEREGQLVGAIRLTSAVKSRLPLSAGYPSLGIQMQDLEVSRVVVDKEHRTGFVFLEMIRSLISRCEGAEGRILIDSCIGGMSNVRVDRYLMGGFSLQGLEFWDQRYNAPSKLLYIPRSEVSLQARMADAAFGNRLL